MKLGAAISRSCAAGSRSLDLLVRIDNCGSVAGRRTIVLERERTCRRCGEDQRSYESREQELLHVSPLVSNLPVSTSALGDQQARNGGELIAERCDNYATKPSSLGLVALIFQDRELSRGLSTRLTRRQSKMVGLVV
jgi:hypothetical protein